MRAIGYDLKIPMIIIFGKKKHNFVPKFFLYNLLLINKLDIGRLSSQKPFWQFCKANKKNEKYLNYKNINF